jgi:hypothetical protein
MSLDMNRSSELPSSSNNQPSKSLAMSTQNKSTPDDNSETQSQSTEERKQPIPPPSHPRQYRAIGLIRARYQISGEQMTQGMLVTPEGTEIEAVLLGRVISLIKKHLDLNKDHLWVVYPRTRAKDEHLHVQIVGVWEPETLSQTSNSATSAEERVEDGYFSIRGEVVFYSQEQEAVVIKIKQFPRKEGEKSKFFKLNLKGTLSDRPLRRFWDLKVRLQGEILTIEEATDLGFITSKRRNFKGKGRFDKPRSKRPTPKSNKPKPISSSRPTPPIKKPKS